VGSRENPHDEGHKQKEPAPAGEAAREEERTESDSLRQGLERAHPFLEQEIRREPEHRADLLHLDRRERENEGRVDGAEHGREGGRVPVLEVQRRELEAASNRDQPHCDVQGEEQRPDVETGGIHLSPPIRGVNACSERPPPEPPSVRLIRTTTMLALLSNSRSGHGTRDSIIPLPVAGADAVRFADTLAGLR
jgi:hypothetical protein